MHWCIYNGLHRALEYLLDQGADWRIADTTGTRGDDTSVYVLYCLKHPYLRTSCL